MREPDHSDNGWADRPGPRRLVRLVLYGICAVLLVAEVLVHRHTTHDIESVPAFYALYGFIALVFAVMAARGLRRLVKRDEDYYDHDA